MRFNSDAAIAQARSDIRQYGSPFAVVAAATRRADGVLVLSRGPQDQVNGADRQAEAAPPSRREP